MRAHGGGLNDFPAPSTGSPKSVISKDIASTSRYSPAEVRSFYETMVDRYIGQATPEVEARRLARINVGHPENAKEHVRDIRAGAAFTSIVRNLKYAFQGMRKAPLSTVVKMLTLAIEHRRERKHVLHYQEVRVESSAGERPEGH